MDRASCVSKDDHVTVICYVEDWLLLAKADGATAQLKRKLGEDLIMEDLGTPTSILGIEILFHEVAVCLCLKPLIGKLLE